MLNGKILKRTTALLTVVVLIAFSGCAAQKVNPLDGEISFDYTTETIVPRDDADEVKSPVNSAGLSVDYEGGADELAKTMRNKILDTENTEHLYEITGTKYYVSPGGNDENDGKSPENAIRTIEGIKMLPLNEGDAVLFERDSVFRLSETINTEDGVIYGSYGEGEKPKIYASPENFANAEWKPSKRKNVWCIFWGYSEAGALYLEHGKEIGRLKRDIRLLKSNNDFCVVDNNLYLYCDSGNPANVYESIEIATKVPQFTIPQGTSATVDNLCLKYSSWIAVKGHYNCKNVIVTNCEIGYIGGWLYSSNVRAGNAIQCWNGVEKFHVKNCWIYQTFDTAVSWQGNGGDGYKYTDIVFTDNLTEYNNADYEFWDHGATLGNMTISNNLMRFTALGWGTRKDDGGIRGIEGVFYSRTHQMVHTGKITVENNTIDCPGRKAIDWNILSADSTVDNWSRYTISGTKVYWKEKYRTTGEVVRNCKKSADEPNNVFASDKEGVLAALQKFDKSVKLNWLE